MSTKPFATIDFTNLALGLIVTVLSGSLWGRSSALASGIGAALACVNLWVIRRLAARAVSRAAVGDRTSATWLVAAMGMKMILLFAMVWVSIRVFDLALAPFAIGISILPVSLVFTGLWLGSTVGEEGKA